MMLMRGKGATTRTHAPRPTHPLVGRVGEQSQRSGDWETGWGYRGLSATFQVRKGRDLDSRDVSLHSTPENDGGTGMLRKRRAEGTFRDGS